ncbi:flagellar filament capping protein FliD [Paenibacillus odorifer]|uniref:flagellar filament capping protein FliD n=1 Tax=Paenibacillus TaxID=44249 RepID=UPI00096F285A|nr:flagellar filament capping protein FliD [Paenibacillus odorifer]OMD00712.1 hypothetical protein BJP49_06200 [Paenibacillus odorifer]OME28211.1 hypothetical protein BSK57_00380 [Paenibacillus odorifer]OME35214.1 hypothetical protein BSK63_06890 [Paenibacillus odorifer]OME42617.1 hypothetical protein BSK46_02115 [Paenibacillus odorifer]
MVTRVSGIVSGLDVESLVKQMMAAKRIPLDKLNQQKQTLQWQRDNYREINSKLIEFQNTKLKAYDKSSALNTQTSVVSGNTTALKADATADANGIPMKMEITQLAKPVTRETGAITLTDGTKITSASKLSALTGASATSAYNITINGTEFSFSKDASISDVVSKININTKANVTAVFDEVSGKFSIASKTYGSNVLTLSANTVVDPDPNTAPDTSSNSLIDLFGLTGPNTDFKQAKVKVLDNTDPTKFTELSFDSNNFILNGVSFTLLSTTVTGNPTTVTTQSDSTKSLETITSFVKDYNDLISMLQSKIDEERYKDFTPLSDEQKKEMTDNDIELWEKKAKSGLLRNDEILKSAISSMRYELSNKLGDLSLIGITTGSYSENGKLYINETKLKESLLNNPQKIINLFQGGSGADGLFDKLITTVGNTLDRIVTKAGTSKFSSDVTMAFKTDSLMGKRLTNYNTRIAALQTRLANMETNYYKQFTAMETAMNKYNSQSSALSGFMAQ